MSWPCPCATLRCPYGFFRFCYGGEIPAMPSPTQFHVFLSAVSAEFRNERAQLENWLERKVHQADEQALRNIYEFG